MMADNKLQNISIISTCRKEVVISSQQSKEKKIAREPTNKSDYIKPYIRPHPIYLLKTPYVST